MSLIDTAHTLLYQRFFLINSVKYRITEIEFYINSDTHQDPYVHKNQDQKSYGNWYFHRYPNGTYKSGTWKGMDLTLGNESTYFGILIRGIYSDKSGHIEGPCRVVNHILKCYGYESVNQLTNNELLSTTNNKNSLILINRDRDIFDDDSIYNGPRIGLNKSKDTYWADVKYRYSLGGHYLPKKERSNLTKIIDFYNKKI